MHVWWDNYCVASVCCVMCDVCCVPWVCTHVEIQTPHPWFSLIMPSTAMQAAARRLIIAVGANPRSEEYENIFFIVAATRRHKIAGGVVGYDKNPRNIDYCRGCEPTEHESTEHESRNTNSRKKNRLCILRGLKTYGLHPRLFYVTTSWLHL